MAQACPRSSSKCPGPARWASQASAKRLRRRRIPPPDRQHGQLPQPRPPPVGPTATGSADGTPVVANSFREPEMPVLPRPAPKRAPRRKPAGSGTARRSRCDAGASGAGHGRPSWSFGRERGIAALHSVPGRWVRKSGGGEVLPLRAGFRIRVPGEGTLEVARAAMLPAWRLLPPRPAVPLLGSDQDSGTFPWRWPALTPPLALSKRVPVRCRPSEQPAVQYGGMPPGAEKG